MLLLLGIKDLTWLSKKKFLGQRDVKEDIINFNSMNLQQRLRSISEHLLGKKSHHNMARKLMSFVLLSVLLSVPLCSPPFIRFFLERDSFFVFSCSACSHCILLFLTVVVVLIDFHEKMVRIDATGSVIKDDDDGSSSGGSGEGGGGRRRCRLPAYVDTFGFHLELKHFAVVLLFVSLTMGSFGSEHLIRLII